MTWAKCDPTVLTLTFRGVTIAARVADPDLLEAERGICTTTDTKVEGLGSEPLSIDTVVTGRRTRSTRVVEDVREIVVSAVYAGTEERRQALRAAMGYTEERDWPLVIGGGYFGLDDRLVYARGRECPYTADRSSALAGLTLFDPTWGCDDSRLYAAGDPTETVLAGTDTAPNAGDRSTPVLFVIEGPFAAPRIENVDTGESWSFPTVTVGAGVTLEIDARIETATAFGGPLPPEGTPVENLAVNDDGKASLFGDLYAEPGGTDFNYTGGGTCTMLTRSCYR